MSYTELNSALLSAVNKVIGKFFILNQGDEMNQDQYTTNKLLFYPGRNLSVEEKRRMDTYEIKIDELTIDHIIYSMSRQIELNFMTFYTVAQDVIGEEKALELAKEIGTRYGGLGYAKLLHSMGMGNEGSPRTMALYQDLVHSIRGPKHAAALFAEYDDKRCVVRRSACIYYSEEFRDNGKYTAAFEQGCFVGYKAADKNLLRVDVIKCLCTGAGSCEQHWVYRD